MAGDYPKYLCSVSCSLQIKVEEACQNDNITIVLQVDVDLPNSTSFEWDLLMLEKDGKQQWSHGLTQNMLFNYNVSNIYYVYYLFDQNYQIIEVANDHDPFVLTYQRYDPKNDVQITLDANNFTHFIDLSKFQ
uniref:Uncharacterized protein n=1 Tax=Panagrolaimus sp. JU765 TaxID=591449 RepID=A0AC34RLF2_9BILA